MFNLTALPKIDYDIRTYRNRRKHGAPRPQIRNKVTIGTTAGTLLPLLFFAKKQNKNIFNIKYGLKEMISVSAGGIFGGVAAGILFDKKEYRKQKTNEGIFQFMNASVPSFCVAGLLKLSEKFKPLNSKKAKLVFILTGLFVGMKAASTISNKINDPFNKVPDRKVTLKDSVANFDDAIGALVLAKIPVAQKIHAEKFLPVIYGWCGYRAGLSN